MGAIRVHPKPRAGRRPFDPGDPTPLEALHHISKLCGRCAGHRVIHCPYCCGFDGCARCRKTGTVRCPDCTGAPDVPAIQW